jgi:hypothetical protein
MSALQVDGDVKAVLQLVMPASWVGRINRLAVERGMNRSALIREAIETAYFIKQPVADSSVGGDVREPKLDFVHCCSVACRMS